MRSFTSSVAFLLLALGLCNLPWSSAVPVCNSEISCSPFPGHSSVPETLITKREGLTNFERLRKRLPLLPPSRVVARHDDDPHPSPCPKVTYTGVIQVFSNSVSLGYIAPDPNYWTPLLSPDINAALRVSFQLDQGSTSGSQLALTQLNDNRGQFFAPVVGRDSTSSNISPGSFNYLYLDPVAAPGTPPGSTPQSAPSYFSTSTGLDKQTETSVWSADISSGALGLQWINTDSSTPSTIAFVQSNHVYAGGDPAAFQSRFPAPVITVTLKFIPA